MKKRILIVDDEKDIVELLTYNFKKENYKVKAAYNGKEAIKVAEDFVPDLIIMDIMMPEMDGIEAGMLIKNNEKLKHAYIVYLTARDEEFSEIAAFEAGADDYLTKPIKPRALMSRIKAYFNKNKSSEVSSSTITIANLKIKKENYSVKLPDGEWVVLPKKEFELLFFLASNPNKVQSRNTILERIWGTDVFVVDRTIDVHIRKVREKIGNNYIKTLKGVGYMFNSEIE